MAEANSLDMDQGAQHWPVTLMHPIIGEASSPHIIKTRKSAPV